eukprot:m.225499 g.225499  ORF g.225499 m.225499 type:complete len:66 (-) comp33461_c1_seq6:423-620(-)
MIDIPTFEISKQKIDVKIKSNTSNKPTQNSIDQAKTTETTYNHNNITPPTPTLSVANPLNLHPSL